MPAARVALAESRCLWRFLMVIIIGIEPIISIMANNVKVMVVISFTENMWQR
jgi:hypothetical protein